MVKAELSKWIKGELNRTAFAWQDGYWVFSVSASGLKAVRGYALGQEEHHRTRTFQEEYLAMLKKAGWGMTSGIFGERVSGDPPGRESWE